MPKGDQICQRVQAVVDLRSALLHYKPTWQEARPITSSHLHSGNCLPIHSSQLGLGSRTKFFLRTALNGVATSASNSLMIGRATWV
jgi:hypothetical protein